jgi:hypothetical protein
VVQNSFRSRHITSAVFFFFFFLSLAFVMKTLFEPLWNNILLSTLLAKRGPRTRHAMTRRKPLSRGCYDTLPSSANVFRKRRHVKELHAGLTLSYEMPADLVHNATNFCGLIGSQGNPLTPKDGAGSTPSV